MKAHVVQILVIIIQLYQKLVSVPLVHSTPIKLENMIVSLIPVEIMRSCLKQANVKYAVNTHGKQTRLLARVICVFQTKF